MLALGLLIGLVVGFVLTYIFRFKIEGFLARVKRVFVKQP